MDAAAPDCDVVVVGGGPVGLVAAIEARLAGLSVILIEQRDGTIDKPCGEGLMPGALPILDRLGVDPAGMPIMGITYNQGGRSVEISNYAAPILRQEVLSAQSAKVSSVGGATYTSQGYVTSLQSALNKANL